MDPLLPSDPTQIDAYSLNGRLGSGGFGVVFSATDSGGTQVALKLLRPELSDDQRLRTRLGREADALRRVGGDRNVEIIDVVTEGDRAYLVMEFVEGETLADRVADQGPLVGPMLWFAAQGLVEALQAIHAAGIVHRDLKPSNVMYGPDGIKVLDFGISVAAEETGLTQTGAFLGTAAWISPEQILGQDVSEATDVFTLGMVLAFAASGRHPYGEGRADAVMYRITNTEPDLEGIQSPLREAVERCMSLDSTQRPTIDQLADFFGSNGDQSLPDAPTMGPVAGGTSIVQPDELAQRLGPRTDDSKDESDPRVSVEYPDEASEKRAAGPTSNVSKKPSKRRILTTLAGLLLLGGGGALAAILMFSQQDDEPNEVAAPVTTVTAITTAAPTTVAPTTVAPTTVAPTTVAPTTTIRLAPTTTLSRSGHTSSELKALERTYTWMQSGYYVTSLQEILGISADSVYGPGTRSAHLNELQRTGLATSGVPAMPTPRYTLWEQDGKNYRWSPCRGAVRIALNANGQLDESNLTWLETFLTEQASQISAMTGLTVAYMGQTTTVPIAAWSDRGLIDILFFVGPPGSSVVLTADESWLLDSKWSWGNAEKGAFREKTHHDIHLNSAQAWLVDTKFSNVKTYAMYKLGQAFGLTSPGDDIDTEVMSWGGWGLGSGWKTPAWGLGDKIAFGLVGASNGCF